MSSLSNFQKFGYIFCLHRITENTRGLERTKHMLYCTAGITRVIIISDVLTGPTQRVDPICKVSVPQEHGLYDSRVDKTRCF